MMTATVGLLLVSTVLLPLTGVAVLFTVHRSTRLRVLFRTLLLGGIAGAGLAVCVGFSRSTVPIAPYESGSVWPVLLRSLAVFLPSGFGLGVLALALPAIPVRLTAVGRRSPPGNQQSDDPDLQGT